MKKLYIALTLIIISVVICFTGGIAAEKSSSQMCDELEITGSLIADSRTEEAKLRLKEAEKLWESIERLFSFIVDADKIEKISVGFSMISAHLLDNNREHALESLRECVFLLKEIAENEKLSIKNVM